MGQTEQAESSIRHLTGETRTNLLDLTAQAQQDTSEANISREQLIDHIQELVSDENLEEVYGFLVNLNKSEFLQQFPSIKDTIAQELLEFVLSYSDSEQRFVISVLPIMFDALFAKRDDLHTADTEQVVTLVRDSIQYFTSQSDSIELDHRRNRMLPLVYFPVMDLFRMTPGGYQQLHRLWSTESLNQASQDLHQLFAAPDIVSGDDYVGCGVLGSGHEIRASNPFTQHDFKMFQEWQELFSSEQGGRYLQILVDTVLAAHRNNIPFRDLRSGLNRSMSAYETTSHEDARDQNVQTKIKLLEVLNVTNAAAIEPQFVVAHFEEIEGEVLGHTEGEETETSILTPELQRKYLLYILRESNEWNESQLRSILEKALHVIDEDAFDDYSKCFYDIPVLVRRLVALEDESLLQQCITSLPSLADRFADHDQSSQHQPENSFIYHAAKESPYLRALFPETYTNIATYLVENIVRHCQQLQFYLGEVDTYNPGQQASIQAHIRNLNREMKDFLRRLHLLLPSDRTRIASTLIAAGFGDEWFEFREDVPDTDNLFEWRQVCLDTGFMKGAFYFDRKNSESDETSTHMGIAAKVFGSEVGPVGCKAIADIFFGELPSYLAELGITKQADAGIAQLQEVYINVKRAVSTEEITPQLLENELVAEIVFNLYNIKKNEYGVQTLKQLKQKYLFLEQATQVDRFVGAEYVDETVHHVKKIDAEETHAYKVSQDTEDAVTNLKQSIDQAYKIEQSPLTASETLDQLRSIIENLVETSKQKLSTTENIHAQQNLERIISELESIQLHSFDDVLQNIEVLSKKKEFLPYIRLAILVRSIKQEVGVSSIVPNTQDSTPTSVLTLEDIRSGILNDLLSEDVLPETFWGNKKLLKKIQDLFYIKSFASEIKHARNVATKDETVPLDFIASRGVHLELSGELADACWATKPEESMAEKYPNVTALVPRLHPGEAQERLVGATLLIETQAVSGESVIVIRGDNPHQTFINSVDLESYHQAIVNRASQIAEAQHAKLVIAISPQSGMATTNRPGYFDYLAEKYENSPLVPIDPSAHATINGYNIDTSCRLVADFS